MNRMRAMLCATLIVLAWLSYHVVTAWAAMPVPSGLSFYKYDAEAAPLLTDDTATAKPMSIGGLAEGRDAFTLQVGLNPWAGPVDIYFGAQILPFGAEIYLFLQDGSLKPLSQVGLLPWKVGISANVSETLLGGSLPVSALPPGVYRLFLAVTPTGSMNAMDLWQADFQIGHWSEEQIEARIMASFGEDGGFSAIALAADQGYSVTQIVCAAMTDRLASTGAITTYLGLAEPPEYAASNMLISGPQLMAQVNGMKHNLAEFVNEFKKEMGKAENPEGKSIIFILIELLSVGYSPGQIIEGIFLQNVVIESIQTEFGEGTLGFPDLYITDENGQRVAPAFRPRLIVEALKATLGGKTSLTLVDGKAEWSWTLSVTEGRKQCATNEFVLAMNFGEGWGSSFICQDPCRSKHVFAMAGIHKVYAKVGCLMIPPLDFQMPAPETVTFKSTSNTVLVEVKPPISDFPYSMAQITLTWTTPGYLLALAAVQEPISNLNALPWEKPTVYHHYPNRPGSAHVAPSETGKYIIVVWVSGVPAGVTDSLNIPFTVTVDETPYTAGGTSYGEMVSSTFSSNVTATPAEPSDIINPFLLGGPVSVTTVEVRTE